jgi:endonuclease YncB( thermonuclease family)
MLRAVLWAVVAVFVGQVVVADPLKLCSGPVRVTCLVDGDTIWIDGEKLRMAGYDTPEPTTKICGGEAEVALAHKASARVLVLLNSKPWTVEYTGELDNSRERELVTIRVEGRDLGEILINEHLARKWPDGDEFWCPTK